MTTIVYDHKNKIVACDSRATSDGFIDTDKAIKYRFVESDLWFMCGTYSDIDIFISEFGHNEEKSKNIRCHGLLIRNGVAYRVGADDGVYKLDKLLTNEGFGSGACFGLAAVDLGLSAKKAVEYAMTRDCYSGGKVHVYDIKKCKFTTKG